LNFKTETDLILNKEQFLKLRLAKHHNSHILDLNNDCLNEIVLELQNHNGNNISSILILEYDHGIKKFNVIYYKSVGFIKDLNFLDLNADGLIDIF